MKKITVMLCLLISGLAFSQEKTIEEAPKFPQDVNKKHELKINALTLLVAKWIDFSYERLIDQESSFGISTTLNTDSDISDLKFALTPYYRRYFSGHFARGFFVEGFGMLFSAKDTGIFQINHHKYETGFGLGVSVGGKLVSKQGFTTEVLLGVGRNFINNDYNDVIGRIGISVGYRF